MVRVNLAQAQAQLSELLDQVEAGEDIVITRDGRPVAHISAIKAEPPPSQKSRSMSSN